MNVFTGMGGLVDHIGNQFRNTLDKVEISNIADDGILGAIIRDETVTETTAKRAECLFRAAQLAKPDLIVCTCSSIGDVADACAATSEIPILRIDYPLVSKALETSDRIAVLATLRSTLLPTTSLLERVARENGRKIQVESILINGAMDAMRAGKMDQAVALVLDVALDAQKRNGVLMMAQASFDLMRGSIQPKLSVPMLVSPPLCAEYIREHISK
ncbi:MAG: aspartate/glutamate racemase family protein [Christensenella sp.]